jgi:exonuclease SbcC
VKPLRLSVSNFQSFRGEHTVPLAEIKCAVLSGPNGAGKSTLAVDSIRFCLWGYARGGTLATVVTEGEETCRVEFEFGLGNERYLVSRQYSNRGGGKTVLSFQRWTGDAWQPLDKGLISQTLHMTDALFTQTACANQGNASAFSRALPSERKEVLADILDLGAWEVRAKATRGMADRLQATRDVQTTALTAAEAKAATASEIEGLLGGLATRIAGYQGLLAEQDQALANRATEREALIGARATDEANRTALVEATQRQKDATGATDSARKRLGALQAVTIAKQAVVDALGAAERAQTEAAELEAQRQQRQQLADAAKVVIEQIRGAKAEHQAAVQSLSSSVESAKARHKLGLKGRREQAELLAKQAEPLDSAKCVTEGNNRMAEECLLIAGAREARDGLPRLRDEIELLELQTPWADDERKLTALQAQTPAADLIAKRDALKEQYDAIAYDAETHAFAKLIAGHLADHQQALTRIEGAEKQLPDARAALEKAQTDLEAATKRVAALRAELGAERNWTAELATLDKQIADARAEQARLRTEIEAAQQRQGALAEQLRAAQEAAAQVETLRAEIAEADRRITLLKVLGNPRDGAFSKAGVPALLLDREIPVVEAEANKVLDVISDGAFSVELRTQKERAAGGLAETLDIIVQTEQGPRAYEQLSGGEQMRIDLALRIGLSSLLAQRAGARVEMFVCDEMAAPLDVRGREAFVESLAKLAQSGMFATVIAISHCDDIIESFPTQIRVSKDGNGSSVEVIHA